MNEMSSFRSALMELSTSVTPNNQQNMLWHSNSTSPEEEVIRQRGRRKAAQIAAANMQALTPPKTPKSPRNTRTPSKLNSGTPVKALPTRTSPRKRLNLGHDVLSTEELYSQSRSKRLANIGSPNKRARLQHSPKPVVSPEIAINALNQTQLVQLVHELIERQPDIIQVINDILPAVDIQPLEAKLSYLQKNILKSIPRNVWSADKDVYCYRRVCTHLDLFKKECIEQCSHLINGHQWKAVMDYVLMAWKYVCKLPNWEDKSHNKIKEMCFKTLASQCMNALKKGSFDSDELELYEENRIQLLEGKPGIPGQFREYQKD
ncbi:tethering factor for nuclear proteasome sts1-like [Centruroides sculpturatus]|uniref:tethering factor for nuclear proteasome sts1-like n=1 Tax=Centruroides sculpturatus TaxID=218467 RepID=UPI000C6E2A82|nr:tethering factor for nuclear proteasome sts1-like [Centruroides sculpturatus]